MEVEAFEQARLFSWIFFPLWIVLTIIQVVCFILYNGRFQPLAKILDGWWNKSYANDLSFASTETKN